jgi:hypothetical protein
MLVFRVFVADNEICFYTCLGFRVEICFYTWFMISGFVFRVLTYSLVNSSRLSTLRASGPPTFILQQTVALLADRVYGLPRRFSLLLHSQPSDL